MEKIDVGIVGQFQQVCQAIGQFLPQCRSAIVVSTQCPVPPRTRENRSQLANLLGEAEKVEEKVLNESLLLVKHFVPGLEIPQAATPLCKNGPIRFG